MLVGFRAASGSVPIVEWLAGLPDEAQVKCTAHLIWLGVQGHRLRRPAAAYLRDNIYELRVHSGRVQLRLLYFFHGRDEIVISHGFIKRGAAVPAVEIERARRNRLMFQASPLQHTYRGPL
jgi:hypothetical protein